MDGKFVLLVRTRFMFHTHDPESSNPNDCDLVLVFLGQNNFRDTKCWKKPKQPKPRYPSMPRNVHKYYMRHQPKTTESSSRPVTSSPHAKLRPPKLKHCRCHHVVHQRIYGILWQWGSMTKKCMLCLEVFQNPLELNQHLLQRCKGFRFLCSK